MGIKEYLDKSLNKYYLGILKHNGFELTESNFSGMGGIYRFKNIPSNEIMILLIRVKDNNTIVKWGDDSTAEDITNYLTDYILPSDKTISLDAEKALIKHLQPEYNRILYKSFPKENDLINKDYHNLILYGLTDPIKLMYENGELKGNSELSNRDYVSVKKE